MKEKGWRPFWAALLAALLVLLPLVGGTAQYGDGAHSCEQTGPIFGHGSSPSARSVRSSARQRHISAACW